MSSDRRSLANVTGLVLMALLAIPPMTACGRKEDPKPPPRKNPAKTSELTALQRGTRIILKMPYPTTTMGGLALPGIDRLVVLQYKRAAAEFMEQSASELDEFEDVVGDAREVEAEALEEIDTEIESEIEEADEDTEADDEDEADREDEEEENPYLNIRFDPEAFRKEKENLVVMEGTDLETRVIGGDIFIAIPLTEIATEPPDAYHFAVITSAGRLDSPQSRVASFVPLPPPVPPHDFAVEPKRRGVRLTWDHPDALEPKVVTAKSSEREGEASDGSDGDSAAEPSEIAQSSDATETGGVEVEDLLESDDESDSEEGLSDDTAETEVEPAIIGFAVYRRSADGAIYADRITMVGADVTEYVDTSANFGASYSYAVTAVKTRSPLVESDLSTEGEVQYRDDFAPNPPTDLVVLAEAGRIRLVWEVSPGSEVASYLVFVTADGGEPQRLTPRAIRPSEFIHEGTISGVTYSYTVVAVDAAGNRSEPSEAATTRAP